MDEPEKALEPRGTFGTRRFSPSAARNRDAIRGVFLEHMPDLGQILELGSGTGEHAIHIASAAPGIRWLPGDPDPESRESIAGWIRHSGLTNVADPHSLDAAASDWTEQVDRSNQGPITGMISINVIHITPFAVSEGLLRGAGELLAEGGRLMLYGPFSRGGAHTAPSNARFDATLRARDRRWGVRDLENELFPLAREASLALARVVDMPANNYAVLFERL